MKQVKVISISSSPNYEQVNHIQELLNTGWEIQACTSTYILLILESTDRVQELEPTTFKERLQVEERELNIKLTKLTQFLDKTFLTEDTKLDPTQLELMVAQQQHMKQYLTILHERMKLLGIPTV
jgi:hypothetical protein